MSGRNRRNRRRPKKGKRGKSKRPSTSVGPVFHKHDNPFANLSAEERRKAAAEISESSELQYREALSQISVIFRERNPIGLLSVLATYGLTVGVGDDGVKSTDSQLNQAHVELAQALALQIPEHELSNGDYGGPDIVQSLWNNISALANAHSMRDFDSHYRQPLSEGYSVSYLQKRMRGHTQMVRNWGSFSQVKRLSSELYGSLDELFKEDVGFTATNAIDFFQYLINTNEENQTHRHLQFQKLYQLGDTTKLVYEYYRMISASEEDAKKFIEEFDVKSAPFDGIFAFLMSHHDTWLQESFQFSAESIKTGLGIDEAIVSEILSSYSLSLGELADLDPESFFLANPVWTRPIIRLSESEFFCVIPQAFFSFIIPCLEQRLTKPKKAALFDARAAFLEGKIAETVSTRFQEASILTNVSWEDGDKRYETDLIAFVDSHVLIIEAKSGKISESALRGAPLRIKRHVNDILVSPSTQSKRLEEKLMFLARNPDVDDELRNKIPVKLGAIHKVIRVSVSFEDFGAIQSNIAQISETGWLPEGFEPCPTMTLADFETLFDFLERPVQILHYLSARQELENSVGYMGDELDLMGLYIGTLFNLGDVDQNLDLVITGMSSPLDVYYNSKDAGVKVEKPAPKVSTLFSEIIDQLEERKTHRWTEIGVILSRFTPDDQLKLTRMSKKLFKSVRRQRSLKPHRNMIVSVPPQASEYALAYVLYNDFNSSQRDVFIQEAAAQGLDSSHVKQCLVIARNVDDAERAYHFIGLME